jgi:hypothetical protein
MHCLSARERALLLESVLPIECNARHPRPILSVELSDCTETADSDPKLMCGTEHLSIARAMLLVPEV